MAKKTTAKKAVKPATKRPAVKAKKASKAAKAPIASAVKAKAKAAAKMDAMPNKPIAQKQSKSEIYAELAEIAQVTKNDAKNVVAALGNLIERHVKPKGSGQIILPDLGIKVRRVDKKATKAKMGRNPFTGEEIQIPAKPARKSVKVGAMKALKALIEK